MLTSPLILRELRAESRRPWNYWLRLLAGAAVTVVFGAVMLFGPGLGTSGLALFQSASTVLYAGIWILVPLLTADCLSREKREGTLGLLFLTPLTGSGIVTGKTVVHLLRTVTFLGAAFPVLAISVLLGGVGAVEMASAAVIAGGAILLALSAGILASHCCRSWIRTTLLTGLFTGSLFLLHLELIGLSAAPAPRVTGALPFRITAWVPLTASPVVVALATVLVVASRLRATALDDSLSPRQAWLLRIFCRPVLWKQRFRHTMRRKLDSNPIGWLQRYTWSARLTHWGWCAAIILTETQIVLRDRFDLDWLHLWPAVGLLFGVAFTSAGSFRRERQSGALELILVTPLTVDQIILGRLRGIWGQFLFATLLIALAAGATMDQLVYASHEPYLPAFLLWLGSSLATIPVIGLHHSLRQRHFLLGWIWTLAGGLTGPAVALLVELIGRLLSDGASSALFDSLTSYALFASVIQLVFGAVYFTDIRYTLATRAFDLQATAALRGSTALAGRPGYC